MEPSEPFAAASPDFDHSLATVDLSAGSSAPFLLAPEAAEGMVCRSEPLIAQADRSAGAGRALDLVLATALVIFALPLMVLCAVAVLFSSPGPLLFRHTRIGRHGKEFSCLKFRTMVNNADKVITDLLQQSEEAQAQWAAMQKLSYDPRVTPVGRLMRRYCLDELPQLFNVISGDMSVVGPRPIVASEISRFGVSFRDYCSVRPGLTGLWQVSGSHALSYAERVELDSQYARSKSLRLDLLILWRTAPIVLRGQNECTSQ